MKTNLKALLVMLLATALVLPGCKKDEDKQNREDMLTSGSWKLTAMTVDPAIDWFGTQVTNIYAQLPTCVKDDLTIFENTGKVKFDEGATKCDPSAPQTLQGLWTLSVDEKTISITDEEGTESWEIVEMSNSQIKVEYEAEDEDLGVTYTFSATYTKQ